jgi:2-dehydropantoate 2-reductase
VPEAVAEESVVVPLLNGLEHVEQLRRRFGDAGVLPAAIVIESERLGPGNVRQLSPFASVRLAPTPQAEAVRDERVDAGLTALVGDSEAAVLLGKLALLAPIALTTTLRASPIGDVVADPDWRRRLEACVREVAAAAREDGVVLDPEALIAQIENTPPGVRSSMQKDRKAGKPTEIDAIGGAVLRAAARHGLEAPATQALVDGIRAGEP